MKNLFPLRKKWLAKKILIFGFGREGKDTLRFLRRLFPNKVIGIGDRNSNIKYQISNTKWFLGKNYLQSLEDYEIIIKSPGIPFKILSKSDCKKVTSQTEIFFKYCPGKIIGVTGTKGKSTTSALIYKILREELKVQPVKFSSQTFKRVNLIGNIGKPVLDLLSSATQKDLYVYELSSHQLSNLKKSPQIAIFLNIYPEHLDYYRNFKDYFEAKKNIARYQKKEDYFIYNWEDRLVRGVAKITQAKKIPLKNYSDILKNVGISKTPLWGEHNLLNIAAAIKVAEIFQISEEKIKKAIGNFKPLPHRLEYVGNFKGIDFYNDSLSTIPETTIAALKTLGEKVQTLILGGFDRKRKFKTLAKEILKRKIKNLIFFPTTREKIWSEIKKISGKKLPQAFFVEDMKKAVQISYQKTKKGKICLLSPASSSFSIFRDYKERGELFKKYVKKYG